MDGFGVFFRKELRESLRSGRIFIVAAVFLVLGLVAPLLAKYTPELARLGGSKLTFNLPAPQASDAILQFMKTVGSNGVIVAVLLAMGLVAREKERGTAAFALTKPLTRRAFLVAKLAGLAATLGAGVLVGGAVAYTYTALLFKPTPALGFLACCALILAQMLVYGTLTFLGSALARSSLPAAGIGAVAVALFAVVGLVPALVDYTPAGLTNAAGALALGANPDHLSAAIGGNLVIVAAALAATWAAFRRQELLAG